MTDIGFFARIASILPRLRNRFAIVGLVVTIAGFVATRIVAPEYVHAQITAGTVGVLFLVFGQVFHHLGSFPKKDRTKLITQLFLVFVLLVLALIGLTGYFLQSNEAVGAVVNTNYLTTLVGKEPFTEQLPWPLVSLGFEDVQINDISAARRLSAVQIKLVPDPIEVQQNPENGFEDLQLFAHIEIYQTEQEAQERSTASRDSLVSRYETSSETMSDGSFCILGSPTFWTCAGYRGFAYVEVTLSPGSLANLGITTGVVGALLRYTDKMTALATN